MGYHPLADTFLPPEQLFAHPETTYPLELGLCRSCGHVFTLFAVSPVDRYQKQDYSYDSSNSAVSVAHFKEFADAVLARKTLRKNALVVDIGSNVGTLLSHIKNQGHANVLGVEPSANIAKLAIATGIPTINDFFGEGVVDTIRKLGAVDLLLSSNVVNHVDHLAGLLQTARSILSPEGLFVFEVPYLLDLVQGTAFDTIYHEHVHYYGIKPLAACLLRHGFAVSKVERIDYMCGSIRVYAEMGTHQHAAIADLIANEERFGLYTEPVYQAFMERARRVKLTVTANLAQIRAKGGRIIGIGAATKGNTFLNYCRLDGDTIAYITDSSPLKIGKLTPGSHIPIVADHDIDSSATHALILPWNIAPMLQRKLAHLGLQFYVPQVETLLDTNT